MHVSKTVLIPACVLLVILALLWLVPGAYALFLTLTSDTLSHQFTWDCYHQSPVRTITGSRTVWGVLFARKSGHVSHREFRLLPFNSLMKTRFAIMLAVKVYLARSSMPLSNLPHL